MRPVSVRIMHPEPGPAAGPIERWVGEARSDLARRLQERFAVAGAADVSIVSRPPDGLSFGARLRAVVRAERPAGLVVLGSGAIPLATARDLCDLVAAAGSDGRVALTNNRFSADVIAVARASEALADVPDLPADNALPRWLEEVAGYDVNDLRGRWRLALDIDGPLDVLLIGRRGVPRGAATHGMELGPVAAALDGIRCVSADRRAELLIAGRTSAAALGWLERSTAARTRALVEERGLRTSAAGQRPPASVLGALLEHDGPESLGGLLTRFGDAAIIDTRVLLAHRLGPDESAWPAAEDRFASDLLLPDRIADPWLRSLTAAAVAAPIPVVLGGHTLVGPGVRLVIGGGSGRGTRWT